MTLQESAAALAAAITGIKEGPLEPRREYEGLNDFYERKLAFNQREKIAAALVAFGEALLATKGAER